MVATNKEMKTKPSVIDDEDWTNGPDSQYPEIDAILKQKRPKKQLPGVHVESTTVEGLQRCGNWVVEEAASKYASAKTIQEVQVGIQEAQAQFAALGVFKKIDAWVDVAQGKDAATNGVDVKFDIEEDVSLINITTKADVGNNEGRAEAKVTLKNPCGIADQLTGTATTSTADSTVFELVYRLPVKYDANYPLSYGIYQLKQEQEQSSHTQLHRGMFTKYQTFSFLGRHNIRYDATWRNVNVKNNKASFPIREEAGHSLKSSVSHELFVDMLDDNAEFGATLKVENEVAGLGGDAHYVKNAVSYHHRYPLIAGCTFATSLRAGLISPFGYGAIPRNLLPKDGTIFDSLFERKGGATTAPAVDRSGEIRRPTICDRFFLGGTSDVRGFQFRGIGPQAKGDALGGDAFWAMGAHLYAPLPYAPWRKRVGDNIKLHFFANGGANTEIGVEGKPNGAVLDLLKRSTVAAVGAGITAKMAGAQLEFNYCIPVLTGKSGIAAPGFQFGAGFEFL